MRTLLVIVIATAILAGCSGGPDASDLTKEQKAALQAMGEILTPDAGHERYKAARRTVRARVLAYVDVTDSCKRGTDERRKAFIKEGSFARATNNICLEYYRREKVDGSEKAADWYVAETKKSDDQIIKGWDRPSTEWQ